MRSVRNDVDVVGEMFLHGAEYPNTTGAVRSSCCGTCAFRKGEGTVRPDGVAIADVLEATFECDDFICHVADEDGRHPSCPGWAALTGKEPT